MHTFRDSVLSFLNQIFEVDNKCWVKLYFKRKLNYFYVPQKWDWINAKLNIFSYLKD